MKKICKIIFLCVVIFSISNISFASDTKEESSTEELLKSQKESLNIGSFIKEAEKYTEDSLEGIDISELFNSAIAGKVDNTKIVKKISNIVGKEVLDCIKVLGSIVIIIVIHSILKSISEGLENKSISQITYYVQYILIVTLIMSNFADIIQMIRISINSLVGFMNSLVPLLITLMLTTRKYCIRWNSRTNNIIYNYIHWKFYNINYNTICANINSS